MPREWLNGGNGSKSEVDPPTAEEPDSDPMGEDDLLHEFDYREKDRDSMFDGLRQRLDLVAVMLTVIIAGVTGYVGIQIMDTTRDDAGVGNTDTFFNAQENLTDGLTSFFSQLGTVFVVIVLVVIIGYLMLLRGRR